MKKSMSLNAVMNALKTLMGVIFPLITFPYASNVLQVENLGKVNFANSVCGYFLLFAGLGLSGGLQVCERSGKALGFFVGDVLHQYDRNGHRLPSPVCDHALFGQITGLYGPAPHHELADLLHDHRHRMDLHDL